MPTTTHQLLTPIFNDDWLQRASAGLDDDGRELLARTVQWVQQPLMGLKASTDEPLADHSAAVVLILAELGTDAETRASALLTVLPDTQSSSNVGSADPIRKEFGPEVTSLVQGTRALLRLGHITGLATEQSTSGNDQKEKQRKMLLAMAADLRIVLMRLASRLQSLRWFAASKLPCPLAFAQETMTLYTPLANRLGIWQLKWEMEDLSFRFLQPDVYKTIAKQLEEKRTEREAFIEAAIVTLKQAFDEAHIVSEISGRPKHIYSIWNKMRNKNLEFHQLFDLRALRVIVDNERDCYAALALAHSLWAPISEEFDDYISRPKPNGYRSLHTVVADAQGRCFELQIRTQAMHQFAEYGMAAHWRYKEAGHKGGQQVAAGSYDQKISWMRQLLATDKDPAQAMPKSGTAQKSDDAGDKPKTDKKRRQSGTTPEPASNERIYVMTPQARVIELPAGATPVDFAYYLHTDLGHRCRGARVDGQMVPLLTRLQTGQTVDIIAAKSGGPSRDWLNPQLGFLASPRSRGKVRAWFNAIELQQRIAQGQVMVEKELQRLGKTAINLEQLAQQLDFACADDLYVAAAKDEFSLRHIDQILKAASVAPVRDASSLTFATRQANVNTSGKSGVLVVGVDSLLTQLARCCRPAPPDAIAGFVTRGRGVSIHRIDCPSYQALMAKQPERLIEVGWGDTGKALYPIDITIHAQEHANLLRDLSEVFARLRINVISVNTHSRRSLAHMVFTIEVHSGDQITHALNALNELTGVSANRY